MKSKKSRISIVTRRSYTTAEVVHVHVKLFPSLLLGKKLHDRYLGAKPERTIIARGIIIRPEMFERR